MKPRPDPSRSEKSTSLWWAQIANAISDVWTHVWTANGWRMAGVWLAYASFASMSLASMVANNHRLRPLIESLSSVPREHTWSIFQVNSSGVWRISYWKLTNPKMNGISNTIQSLSVVWHHIIALIAFCLFIGDYMIWALLSSNVKDVRSRWLVPWDALVRTNDG